MMMDPNALAQESLEHFFDTNCVGHHHQNHHHHHHQHHHHHHHVSNSIHSFFHRPHHHNHNTLFSKLISSLPFQQPPRWSFLDIDDNSVEDCCDLVMAAGKSGNFKMLEPLKHPTTKKRRRDQSRGKSPGRSSMIEVMDRKIWKHLPEDLLEAVIARLPIATIFRFRSVCWGWNSLLTSQSFSQHGAHVQQANPWFYTITHDSQNSGAMYDPSVKKWYHQTVSALPTNFPLYPVTSAGGLVCFIDYGNRNFYVCNPLTQSFKELPARSVQGWSRVAVGMTANGNSAGAGYKILWVSFNGQYDIYDSIRKSWSSPGNIPAGLLPLMLELRSHSVSVDSTIYFMHSFPWEGILSFDTETAVWKEYIIPKPSVDLIDYTLAECDGRIMFVGLLKKNAAACVCIWELQKMTLLWKEVDRMPNVWCLDLYGKHVTMTCLGNKGLLMLSLRSKQMNRLVTYNMASREWLKVPGCVMPHGKKRRVVNGYYGTAFHPCPTAVA